MSKTEKRNAAKKVAEAKAQAKKGKRAMKEVPQVSGKAVKGKKPLTSGKKK